MAKLTHPSVLSVIRSHNVSAFPFYGVKATNTPLFGIENAELKPVVISREAVRGTQAAASTTEAKRGVPNVQRIDFARLPHGTDALIIEGTVLVTGSSIALETCNDAGFKAAHNRFVKAFADADGFRALAERYVMNLLNGTILFRNRLGNNIRCAIKVDDLSVEIAESDFTTSGHWLSKEDIASADKRNAVEAVIEVYAKALAAKTPTLRVSVRAYSEFGLEQEVYPSQEFAEDQEKGEGRVLARAARTDLQQAAFHGRKVGNALRTIDTWYESAVKALPVEPFGVDQAAQAALRGGKSDFYSLMLQMDAHTETLLSGSVMPEALFVAAVFIRGGVFSKKAG